MERPSNCQWFVPPKQNAAQNHLDLSGAAKMKAPSRTCYKSAEFDDSHITLNAWMGFQTRSRKAI